MAIADAITHMDVAVICIENVKLVNKIFVHYIFSRWALSLFPLCRMCTYELVVCAFDVQAQPNRMDWVCVQMNTLYTHSCCLDSNFINHDFHYWITIREVNMRKGDRSFCVLHKNFMDVSVTVDDDAYINRHSAENSHWNAHPQFGCFHSIPLFRSLALSLTPAISLCVVRCVCFTYSIAPSQPNCFYLFCIWFYIWTFRNGDSNESILEQPALSLYVCLCVCVCGSVCVSRYIYECNKVEYANGCGNEFVTMKILVYFICICRLLIKFNLQIF